MSKPESTFKISDALNIDLKEESQRKYIDRVRRMNVVTAANYLKGRVERISPLITSTNEWYQASTNTIVKVTGESTCLQYRVISSDTDETTAQRISYVQYAVPQKNTIENARLRLKDIIGIMGIPAHPQDPQIADYFKKRAGQEKPRTLLYISEEGYMTKLFKWPDTVALSRQYGYYPEENLTLANPTQVDFTQLANILNLFSRELAKT